MDMQDISTAPLYDEVLVWGADCGFMLARHTCIAEITTTKEQEDAGYGDDELFRLDWFGGDSTWSGRLEDGEKPTHWVRLTPPST